MLSKAEFAELFSTKLEQFRDDVGLTQQRMAEIIGMSLSAYKRMISLESMKVDLYSIYVLYETFGKYPFDWIAHDDQIANIIMKLRECTQEQRNFIEQIVIFESEYSHDNPIEENDIIDVLVLTGDMEDGMVYDSSHVEKVHIGKYKTLFPDDVLCGIRITSNHLHPAYVAGDILLISKSPVRDGDTGIFVNINSNRAYVRKFRQKDPCLLEPINGYGSVFSVDPKSKSDMDQWVKFGKVICKMRI